MTHNYRKMVGVCFQPQSKGAAYKRGFQNFNNVCKVVKDFFKDIPNLLSKSK